MQPKLLLPIIALLFFSACVSSRDHLSSGDYDTAIRSSVQKLRIKKTREKEILVLEEAYNKATRQDFDRIAFLEKEALPQNWDAIYNTYLRISYRQALVKPLLPLEVEGRTVYFEMPDLDEKILRSKYNAADYLYLHAMKLLEGKNRADARTAYYELEKVKNYYPAFRNVDEQLKIAAEEGTSRVLLQVENRAYGYMSPALADDLLKINAADISGNWVNVDTYDNGDIDYDYTLLLNIKSIDVGPETVRENRFIETREIQDGFTYVFDAKGNVKKDSLGNDIKVPRYCLISCQVIETFQKKTATIRGTLDFYNNSTMQLIKSEPLYAEAAFDHRFATAAGDINALKPETRQGIGSWFMNFPSDIDMAYSVVSNLKGKMTSRIRNSYAILN
jgi:hypothetical protein